MRTGSFHGWSQSIADAIKLLEKEDIVPKKADRWIFNIAPYVIFLPVLLVLIVLPYGERLIPKDLNIGILYILAVSSLAVVAILMGGYSSNNKYSLLGALRSVSQLISYEIPLVLSILGVVLIAGTMSMGGIVEAQRNMWYIVYQPVGFLIYIISATAEVNRTPFDLPEAEQEIVAGYATEYSGMKFAMFFLAEFGNAFIVSAIATTLFLGGWLGPFLPGFVWFFIKTFAVVFILMWFRWTFPRFRLDQLTDLGWKVLVPLGFINLLGTAFLILYV
jgi:NADH-quinone oxidoreductase subunit H